MKNSVEQKNLKKLSLEELVSIIQMVSDTGAQMAMYLIGLTGLSSSAVLALTLDDIVGDKVCITEKKNKFTKVRKFIKLDRTLLKLLQSYMHKQKFTTPWLFPNLNGGNGPLSSCTLNEHFKEALSQSGVHKRVSISSLRHSMALQFIGKLMVKSSDIRKTSVCCEMSRSAISSYIDNSSLNEISKNNSILQEILTKSKGQNNKKSFA